MAKKKKIQEQPRAKIAKVPASELNPRKMKKPVVGENPGQPQIKDNLTGSSAAKLKDLPPTEIAKVSTGASNKSSGVTPLVEAKTEAESKTPSDLTPQLVKRVHELYEELGREEVRAVQDWDNNQRKVQKPEAESEAKHGVQIEPEPEAKIEPATDSKAKPQAGINVESKTDSKQETRDQPKQDVKTETKPDIKTGKPKDKKKGQSQGKGNTPQADGQKLKDLPLADVQKQLSGSVDGLSKAEAQTRLEKYGYNELTEKKNSAILLFLSYFWGPIPIMIIIAAVLSAVLRHWPDLAVIVALLLLNAIVGFREEHQAGNVIAALKKKLAVLAKVKRDGAWVSIPSRELVPGDVVRVRIGDIVPADARLFDGEPVEVDQSALTGESLPVEHKPGDAVYSGSIIKRGEIDALVYATGSGTFYGKTAELVKATGTHSHLQRAVTKIANFLIYIAAVPVACSL